MLDHELREHGVRCTNVCPARPTDFALEEGYGRTPDVLDGMMSADDVAEVVLFASRVPARIASRDCLATDDGAVMGMRLGIVSTADINRKVIPGAHASDKVDLVAVASREQRRAEEYAQTWEIERAYGSYEALLEDPDVDAVYISLPNTLHREWSVKALGGKHVICEKPFSRRVEDVEAAFDAAERAGRHLTEAFMYRHNPQTHKLAELVRDGAIGELRVTARRSATRSTTRTTSACAPTSTVEA